MTAKRRWPNEADGARLDSITLAEAINRQILPMLDALENNKSVSALELALRLSRINDAAGKIKSKLIEAGPRKFLKE
jgi:hypothetical protein